MSEVEFWNLIATAKESSKDKSSFVVRLVALLSDLSPREIIAFEEVYDQFRFGAFTADLWCAASLLAGGCSDDGFEYFRGWLIAQGREVYSKAVRDPDSLADLANADEDFELEDLLYVADRAHIAVCGSSIPDRHVKYPKLIGSFPAEEELRAKFPQLSALAESDLS